MKRILFIVTSTAAVGSEQRPTGYEFSEVADPYAVFVQQGYEVDFASPLGGTPPAHGYDAAASGSRTFFEGVGYAKLNRSLPLREVPVGRYDAIFFPGGLGPLVDLAADALVKQVIADAYEGGQVVGAVCHGPAALLHTQLSTGQALLAGKRVTAFTAAEEAADGHHLGTVIPYLLDEALVQQGAHHSHAAPFAAHVVVDGRLITGQNPASAEPVAQAMVKLLENQ